MPRKKIIEQEKTGYRYYKTYLTKGIEMIDSMSRRHRKVMQTRMDFRYPQEMKTDGSNKDFSRALQSLTKELNREGVTIVWITHFMDEAARSDRVIVIDEGKIALQGTPKEIFSKAEQIKSLGLDVPDMTYLAQLLRLRGLNVSDDILTIDEMEVELCRFM